MVLSYLSNDVDVCSLLLDCDFGGFPLHVFGCKKTILTLLSSWILRFHVDHDPKVALYLVNKARGKELKALHGCKSTGLHEKHFRMLHALSLVQVLLFCAVHPRLWITYPSWSVPFGFAATVSTAE